MTKLGSLTRWAAVAVLAAGCSLDGILKSDELPPDVTDPALTQTPEGAVAAYHGARVQFQDAFGGAEGGSVGTAFVAFTGALTDELQWGSTWLYTADIRQMLEGVGDDFHVAFTYSRLQRARAQAGQAIELLTRYAPDSAALAGHAYALQGYTEIFLAELFCSGIPLSTLDYEGDFTYRPGSTTAEVFTHALALFDTAATLVEDSARFVHLVQVGQARARLALGEFGAAAAAAAEVPDGYRFTLTYSAATNAVQHFARLNSTATGRWEFAVGDGEGSNGLNYISSDDPRTRVTAMGTNSLGLPVNHPNKYDMDGADSALVLASAVEARLIEAEAALQEGGDWLSILNALRVNGTFTTQPNADDPTLTDTLWNAGSGGVDGLAPLEDPGTPEAQVDLLFRERAFWLFLTGHRQGDLRRLIRQYGRTQDQVYPVGAYPGTGNLSYGSDVTAPIPPEERVSNPHFTGCAARGA